jgi:hypothetical protein
MADEAKEREEAIARAREMTSRRAAAPLVKRPPRTPQPSRILRVWIGNELVWTPDMDERAREEAMRMALRNQGLL